MTTTTQTQTNNRSSHMPSQRDFEIFRLAVIKGFTHKELAGMFEISRRRVGQIVEHVRNWLSQHPCEDPNIATELQNKRLAQHLERMHLEDIISQARHEVSFGKQQLITKTERSDGTITTTYREQPFNIQVLKTYLRAVEALGRLSARPEIPLPPPPGDEFPWLVGAVTECYEKWYSKIWSKRLSSEMVYEFVNDTCADMLKAAKHQQDLAARPNEPAPGDTEAPAQDDEAPAEPVGRARVGRGSPDPAQSATEGLPPATPARSAGSEDTFNSDSPPLGTEYSVPSTTQSPPASDSAARVGRGSPDPAQPPTEGLPASTDVSTMDLGPWTLDSTSTPSPASLPEAPASQDSLQGNEAPTPVASDTSASSP